MSFGITAESHTTHLHADQHDATLMIELFKISHSPEMMEAWAWFANDFKTKTWATIKKNLAPGSEKFIYLRRVLDYWDMVGVFVAHNVLNKALLFDTVQEPLQVWAKIEPWIADARKELGAGQWAHIEDLARLAAEHADIG